MLLIRFNGCLPLVPVTQPSISPLPCSHYLGRMEIEMTVDHPPLSRTVYLTNVICVDSHLCYQDESRWLLSNMNFYLRGRKGAARLLELLLPGDI